MMQVEINSTGNPLEQTFVALDLETTGLDAARDTIIEVGAVKFQGEETIDSFQTFINPGRAIPEFIQRLTGISPQQVRRAPPFSAVVADLEAFLGPHPIIGHNISFDLRFLETHGLPLGNPSYDTWDLASMFLPRSTEYSLVYLSRHLGVKHTDAHRALSDAKATQGVFLHLLAKAARLDPGLLAYIINQAAKSRWGIASLLGGLSAAGVSAPGGRVETSSVGLSGLDLENLASRLGRPERRRSDSNLAALDEAQISRLLSPGGPFDQAFAGFENRPEQAQMLAATTQAIYQGRNLIVEGGTGVGKSMAYLLPAALFAASKGQRVVISTNTINLQEQLLTKDIPALTQVLESAGLVDKDLIKAAPLKGRANYLCLRRWGYLARSENPSVDDARLLGKTSVWLQDTTSGDRGEINLSGRDALTWSRVSAGEKAWCAGLRDGGACFLRSARERAEQAHIIVVNHALLLSDLAHGGSLIPEYKYLIVDEAHHLEDEATRQFGFQVGPEQLDEGLEPQGRLTTQLRLALSAEALSSAVRQQGELALSEAEAIPPRLREAWARLWSAGERFVEQVSENRSDDQLLLTPALRSHKGWQDLALAWENVDVVLTQATQRLSQVYRFLESTDLPAIEDQGALALEAATIQDNLEQLKGKLSTILGSPSDRDIHWIARGRGRGQDKGELVFHSAPLEVSTTLSEELLARKDSVVFTSATLATQGNFDYLRERLGIAEDSDQLLVGSPFDYQKAALLLIPEDMPPPSADGYMAAMSRVLVDLGKSLNGRTMALFTSYAALRGVSQQIRAALMAEGIQVLAQSIDGSPQQLLRRFSENPKSVLLGTSSFWEGVDLSGDVLKALVLTRLPFQVPTDPIVRARSDQYADAFHQYSVPQAVLRFRQGIGRLIRNKGDKGTLVVLDKRITGRSYGQAFLKSIPPCTLQPSTQATVGTLAAQWVRESNAAGH
jgi:predicted DnaQ family exonuclease/DinG family helicase